jgi:hypothetical protein
MSPRIHRRTRRFVGAGYLRTRDDTESDRDLERHSNELKLYESMSFLKSVTGEKAWESLARIFRQAFRDENPSMVDVLTVARSMYPRYYDHLNDVVEDLRYMTRHDPDRGRAQRLVQRWMRDQGISAGKPEGG